jgi:hypothetical protein
MVVNIVDVGWATSKSGCLPISGSNHSKIAKAAAKNGHMVVDLTAGVWTPQVWQD